MKTNIRKHLKSIAVASALGIGAYVSAPGAALIATDQAVPQQSERERVKALAARPEVARKLETLGVPPKDAQSRIDALTDAEVVSLAGRIDALPAGALSDQNWLLVIIIILLVLILV